MKFVMFRYYIQIQGIFKILLVYINGLKGTDQILALRTFKPMPSIYLIR
jgi:hypothetical protein